MCSQRTWKKSAWGSPASDVSWTLLRKSEQIKRKRTSSPRSDRAAVPKVPSDRHSRSNAPRSSLVSFRTRTSRSLSNSATAASALSDGANGLLLPEELSPSPSKFSKPMLWLSPLSSRILCPKSMPCTLLIITILLGTNWFVFWWVLVERKHKENVPALRMFLYNCSSSRWHGIQLSSVSQRFLKQNWKSKCEFDEFAKNNHEKTIQVLVKWPNNFISKWIFLQILRLRTNSSCSLGLV